VSDCLFDSNMQSGEGWPEAGGAVYVEYASPAITHCTFLNNTSSKGSAIVCEGSLNAAISHSVFMNNTGRYGPVVCDAAGSPTVSGNVVSGNFASEGAGGILISNGSTARVENNIVVHNQTPASGGGIVCWTDGDAVIINNTIAYNSGQRGGGISCEYDSDPTLINNIVYGNSATQGNQLYLADNGSDPMVAYCDMQGGMDALGGAGAGANYSGLFQKNIDSDPLFVDAASADYRLSDSSPCIGTGIDSVEISGVWHHVPLFCFGGNDRPSPKGSMPDIGARENLLASPVVGVTQALTQPKEFLLYQNYPNPFNPTTTIQYTIAEGMYEHTSLRVYDLLGREVAVLVYEKKAPGSYKVGFDGAGLPTGVYIYRLNAGQYAESRKLILLR